MQLDLTPGAYKRLQELQALCEDDVRTHAELIRRALRVYEYLVRQATENDQVTLSIRKGGTVREVELLL